MASAESWENNEWGTGHEPVRDDRREYLAHVLSRTKRKDYENYIVNAV